jgi:hypothetical protein
MQSNGFSCDLQREMLQVLFQDSRLPRRQCFGILPVVDDSIPLSLQRIDLLGRLTAADAAAAG